MCWVPWGVDSIRWICPLSETQKAVSGEPGGCHGGLPGRRNLALASSDILWRRVCWSPAETGTRTWALREASSRRPQAMISQGEDQVRRPAPSPWAATSSDPSISCCVPSSPPSTAAMGRTMEKVSGSDRRSRGNIQRSGAPWEKISREMAIISHETSRNP